MFRPEQLVLAALLLSLPLAFLLLPALLSPSPLRASALPPAACTGAVLIDRGAWLDGVSRAYESGFRLGTEGSSPVHFAMMPGGECALQGGCETLRGLDVVVLGDSVLRQAVFALLDRLRRSCSSPLVVDGVRTLPDEVLLEAKVQDMHVRAEAIDMSLRFHMLRGVSATPEDELFVRTHAGDADVVLWNGGLHDLKHQPRVDIVQRSLPRFGALLTELCGGATLVWATTTTVLPDLLWEPRRNITPANVVAFNTAVGHAVAAHVLPTPDLVLDAHRLSTTIPRRATSDGVHYNGLGPALADVLLHELAQRQ